MLIASGRAGNREIVSDRDGDFAVLRDAVADLAAELAQAIIRDGEGATKFITVRVEQGAMAARNAARWLSRSPIRRWSRPHSSPPTPTSAASLRHRLCRHRRSRRIAPATVRSTTCCVVERRRSRDPWLSRRGRAAGDEAGARSRSAWCSRAARPPRPCGPAISRTTTSPSTPTTGADIGELRDCIVAGCSGASKRSRPVEALLPPAPRAGRLARDRISLAQARRRAAPAAGPAPARIQLDDLVAIDAQKRDHRRRTRGSSSPGCRRTTCCSPARAARASPR